MQLFQVDAFTAVPFSGNPAGVCLLESAAPDAWMQRMAAEMNLAETAFLYREGDRFRLRWFTPTAEVPLCGHATIASAHVLWERNVLARNERAVFESRSGTLTAERADDWIALDFPAYAAVPAPAMPDVDAALGTRPAKVYRVENRWLLAELASAEELQRLRPDIGRVRALDANALLATAPGGPAGCDYVLRFFAPSMGIDEDPVTGSAQCVLAPFWSRRLGKSRLRSRQLSPRGGDIRAVSQPERNRVRIEGQAVTVFSIDVSGNVPGPEQHR